MEDLTDVQFITLLSHFITAPTFMHVFCSLYGMYILFLRLTLFISSFSIFSLMSAERVMYTLVTAIVLRYSFRILWTACCNSTGTTSFVILPFRHLLPSSPFLFFYIPFTSHSLTRVTFKSELKCVLVFQHGSGWSHTHSICLCSSQ